MTKKFFYLVFMCFCFISCYKKIEDDKITVTGVGTVTVQPDKASIIVSVITEDINVKHASDANANTMNTVYEAVVKAGIEPHQITTTNYNIRRLDSWSNNLAQNGQYQVRNSMKIVVFDMDNISNIIDTAIGAGANELNSLTFTLKDNETVVHEAQVLAVNNAKQKADIIAQAGNRSVDKVLTIVEHNDGLYAPQMMVSNASFDSSFASTPLSAGNVTVSASVTITYKLKK